MGENIKAAAHDEHTKVQEINFINSMEENIKKQTAVNKIKQVEDQFAELMIQREKDKERYIAEQNERENAAEERRQLKEQDRREWLQKLCFKRKTQELRIAQQSVQAKQQLKDRDAARLARKKEQE